MQGIQIQLGDRRTERELETFKEAKKKKNQRWSLPQSSKNSGQSESTPGFLCAISMFVQLDSYWQQVRIWSLSLSWIHFPWPLQAPSPTHVMESDLTPGTCWASAGCQQESLRSGPWASTSWESSRASSIRKDTGDKIHLSTSPKPHPARTFWFWI